MNEEPQKLDANNTLTQVLGYVNSPFKLFAIVIMAVLAFSGYFVWQNQGFLMQAYEKKKSLPVMNSSKYEDVSKMLIKSTGATLVAIFEVDLMLNTRTLVRVYDKDGRIKTMDGYKTPLLSNSDSANKDAIALMAGQVPCHEYTVPRSILGIFYIDKGVNYICRVSVPSSPNAFIGQITVGFDKKPTIEMENYLRIAGDDLMMQ